MSLKETKLTTKDFYQNSFLRVHEDDVLLPDGNQAKRVVVDHPGAVNIIALTEEKELIMVRQYRYAIEQETIETPAGKLEPGENHAVTAKRELEEETGYTCEQLELIAVQAPASGYTNELFYQYLATGLSKLEVAVAGDDDEFIELQMVNKDQALMMVATGEIIDLKTIYAIQYLTIAGLW